jgi:hypothetical protein
MIDYSFKLKIFKKVKGFVSLTMSDPIRGGKYIQYCCVKFESQEICRKISSGESEGGLNGKYLLGLFHLNMFSKDFSKNYKDHVLRDIFSNSKRVKQDLKQCLQLIKHFDKIYNIENQLLSIINFELFNNDLQRINLATEYLRRVYFICYYQTNHFFKMEHMLNKYFRSYIRRYSSELTKLRRIEQPFQCERVVDNWLKSIIKKSLITTETNWKEQKKKKICDENTIEVKIGQKYRCTLCRKAFKGRNFVKKHILNKHIPIVKLYLDKEEFLFIRKRTKRCCQIILKIQTS